MQTHIRTLFICYEDFFLVEQFIGMDFPCRQIADHIPKDLAVLKHSFVFPILVEDFSLTPLEMKGIFLRRNGQLSRFLVRYGCCLPFFQC